MITAPLTGREAMLQRYRELRYMLEDEGGDERDRRELEAEAETLCGQLWPEACLALPPGTCWECRGDCTPDGLHWCDACWERAYRGGRSVDSLEVVPF